MGKLGFKLLQSSKLLYVCVLTFLVLAFLITLYYTKNGLGNDFSVFYFAADYARQFSNPWFSSVDPVYSAYVNGPLTAIVISPISLLSIEVAIFVVRLLSVVSIPLNFWLLSKSLNVNISFNSQKLWIASSLLLFSFPVRANLEYGQLFLLFSLFFSLPLFLLRNFSLNWVQVFSGILLGITVDYKPQVFGLVTLILVLRYRRVIIGVIISWLFGGLVSVWLTDSGPFVTWAKAINLRKNGGFTSVDQMNLVSLVNSGFILIILIVSLVGVGSAMIYRNWFSMNRDLFDIDWYLVFVVGFILIPYLHPTDIYIVGVCLVIRLIQSDSIFPWIGLGFLITWSNALEVFVAQTILVFFLSVLLKTSRSNVVVSMIPSLSLLAAVEISPGNESLTRKFMNFLLLLFVFWLEVTSSKAVVR
jgi:hypothetical protein